MMLKIYSDRSIIPPGLKHVIMMYPFWGNPETDPDDPDHGRFDEYSNHGQELFLLTTPEECDVFVLPLDFSFGEIPLRVAKKFTHQAEAFGKKVIVFFNSDDDREIPLKNVMVLRTSFYRTTRKPNEFAIPGWSVDFQKKFGKPKQKDERERPVVGYCGYVDHTAINFLQKLFRIFNTRKTRPWEKLRGKAVRSIMSSHVVEPNVIIRNGFWAEGMTDKIQARKEYAKNMLNSDYAIACRGGGNFSYRLYEAMSAGCIPALIDTDCVLPYEDKIDWKSLLVWINADEAQDADRIIYNHFKRNNQGLLAELKMRSRKTYEDYLSPLGYFSHLHEIVKADGETHNQ